MNQYNISRTVELPLEEAIEALAESLAEEGFGILTDIDVQATINEKLGIPISPYRILGVCNPHYAYQALQLDIDIGTILPCSIVVREGDLHHTEVVAINPAKVMTIANGDAIAGLAIDATKCLTRALDRIAGAVHHDLDVRRAA